MYRYIVSLVLICLMLVGYSHLNHHHSRRNVYSVCSAETLHTHECVQTQRMHHGSVLDEPVPVVSSAVDLSGNCIRGATKCPIENARPQIGDGWQPGVVGNSSIDHYQEDVHSTERYSPPSYFLTQQVMTTGMMKRDKCINGIPAPI